MAVHPCHKEHKFTEIISYSYPEEITIDVIMWCELCGAVRIDQIDENTKKRNKEAVLRTQFPQLAKTAYNLWDKDAK